MRTYDVRRIYDFSGGVNRKSAPPELRENEAEYLLNAEFTERGTLKKRKGYAEYNSTAITDANHIEFILRMYYGLGTARGSMTFLGTDDDTANELHRVTTNGAFQEITKDASKGTAFAANAYMEALTYKNYLWVTDGANPIQFYDPAHGETAANKHEDIDGTVTPPVGKHIAIADNRMFVAGNSDEPNRLYFSELGLFTSDPNTDTDFSADGANLNYIDIPLRDALTGSRSSGDKITGLSSFKDELFIFRQNDVHVLLGTDETDYYMQRVSSAYGTSSARSIVNTGNALVWVADMQNQIVLYANGRAIPIGNPVEDYLVDEDFSACAATFYPKKRLFIASCAKDAAYNDASLVYDMAVGAWTLWDIGFDCFTVYTGETDSGELYAGDANTGKIHQLDTGKNDNGGNIEFTYYSPHFNTGKPEIDKIWRRIYLDINAADETPFTLTSVIDQGRREQEVTAFQSTGFNYWGTLIYGRDRYGGGDQQQFIAMLETGMRGRTMQVQLTIDDKNDLTVFGMGLQNKTRRIRGTI